MGNSNSQPDITNSEVFHDRGNILKPKEVNRIVTKSSAKVSRSMKIKRKRGMKVLMKGGENTPSRQSTSTGPEKLQVRQDLEEEQSPASTKQGPPLPTTPLSQKTQTTCPDSVEPLSLDGDDCSENEVLPTSVMNVNTLLKDAPKENDPSQQSTSTAPEKLQVRQDLDEEQSPTPKKQGPHLPTTPLSQKTQKTCQDSVELLALDGDDCSENEIIPTSAMNVPLLEDEPRLPLQATKRIPSASFSDRSALINTNKCGSDTIRTENGEDHGLAKVTNDMHASFTALSQAWKSASTMTTSDSDIFFPTEPIIKRLFHEDGTEVEDSQENDEVSLASESDRVSLGDLEKPERKQELDDLDQIIDGDDVDDLLESSQESDEVSLASESDSFSLGDLEKPERKQELDELDQIIDDRDNDHLLNDDFDQLMNDLDFEETNDQHHEESNERLPDIAENEENDDDVSLGSNSMFSHSDCSDYGSFGPISVSGRSFGCSVGDLSLTPSTAQKLRERRESLSSSSHGLRKGAMSNSFKKQRPSKPNATNAFETLPRHLIKTSLLRQAASTLRDERFLTRRITKLGAVYAAKVHVSDFVCMDNKLYKDAEKMEEERTSLEAAMPSAGTFADGDDAESVTIDSFELFEKCILELCGIHQMVDFDVSGVTELREADGEEKDEADENGDDKNISPKLEQVEPKISLADGGRALYSLGKYCQKADWNDDAMHFYKHALYLYLLDVGVEESRLLDNSDDCDGFFYINVARSCVQDSSHTHQYLASIFTKMGDVHGKCDEKNDALRAYRASEVFWRKHISDLQLEDNADNADDIVAAVEALALSFSRIGGVYTAKGELDAALGVLFEGLEMQIDTLGDGHIEVAKTLHNIGVCHRHNDDWDSALEYYIRAHEIFEFILGREHLDTVRTLHNIGGVYRRKKEYLKAMECFKEVLLVRRHALGDDHPSVSITLVSMAAVLRRCGKKEEANRFYLAAVH